LLPYENVYFFVAVVAILVPPPVISNSSLLSSPRVASIWRSYWKFPPSFLSFSCLSGGVSFRSRGKGSPLCFSSTPWSVEMILLPYILPRRLPHRSSPITHWTFLLIAQSNVDPHPLTGRNGQLSSSGRLPVFCFSLPIHLLPFLHFLFDLSCHGTFFFGEESRGMTPTSPLCPCFWSLFSSTSSPLGCYGP